MHAQCIQYNTTQCSAMTSEGAETTGQFFSCINYVFEFNSINHLILQYRSIFGSLGAWLNGRSQTSGRFGCCVKQWRDQFVYRSICLWAAKMQSHHSCNTLICIPINMRLGLNTQVQQCRSMLFQSNWNTTNGASHTATRWSWATRLLLNETHCITRIWSVRFIRVYCNRHVACGR